ncbi:homoserine dehydrogenase [Ornithinibacillus scapharcae]|uniref:homoserine dehydrogenase n=1 Tax=Ornithinibacillus scapharcae TaxID=1147159 RepID=UPI0002F988BE|nr:homoserine dehydrogenase [Ornithinibacillus scapharcae]
MKTIRVALLGLGTVGKGVYHHLTTNRKRIEKEFGITIDIATIIVKHPEKHHSFERKELISNDFQTILDNPDIDVVIEAIIGREPAFSYLTKSIQAEKHIITANKEMFAFHGKELLHLANAYNVQVGFEATTAGGIPIIHTIKRLFQYNQISKLTAILNGTSNYILSEMRNNKLSFEEALQQAQQLGYAEANPTNDIEGYDSFYKLMILSLLLYQEQPNWDYVKRKGISTITSKDIANHTANRERIKLLAVLEKQNDNISARVEPLAIPESHPLYGVEGVQNAVILEGSIVGEIMLSGPGAGASPTASAILEDLTFILRTGLSTHISPIYS